jgi:starvation-inducible DNA-binding protein
MTPNIGLNADTRKSETEMLGANLADLHVLYQKTRNYHWNVVGPRFHELHEFFEEQYTEIAENIDEVAERIRQLGGKAPGTMAEYLKTARLSEEQPGVYPDAETMIANLLADHEAIIRQLREDINTADEDCGDTGTADFLTALLEDHEKKAWMLRSFLEK